MSINLITCSGTYRTTWHYVTYINVINIHHHFATTLSYLLLWSSLYLFSIFCIPSNMIVIIQCNLAAETEVYLASTYDIPKDLISSQILKGIKWKRKWKKGSTVRQISALRGKCKCIVMRWKKFWLFRTDFSFYCYHPQWHNHHITINLIEKDISLQWHFTEIPGRSHRYSIETRVRLSESQTSGGNYKRTSELNTQIANADYDPFP